MGCVAAQGGHMDYCDSTCVDELLLINDCASFLVYCHYQSSSIAVHNKNIYCSGIIFKMTFLGGAFSMLFSIYICR